MIWILPNNDGFNLFGFAAVKSTSPAILVKRSEDTIVKFTVDPNGTGNDRTAYYSVVFYDKDNNIYKTEPYIINQDGTQGFLLTESSGYLLQENIDKIRL